MVLALCGEAPQSARARHFHEELRFLGAIFVENFQRKEGAIQWPLLLASTLPID
jgi:hypothetical protein